MTKKFSKKQLQERFFGTKNNDIIKLEKDISEVFFLFEELKQHVDTQIPNISHLEENILCSKQIVENIEENILCSKQIVENIEENILPKENITDKLKHFYYAFIGGSVASVALLYNPYVGLGAISTGFIAGTLFSYFKK